MIQLLCPYSFCKADLIDLFLLRYSIHVLFQLCTNVFLTIFFYRKAEMELKRKKEEEERKKREEKEKIENVNLK